MEEEIKKFIKSIVYYGLAFREENVEKIIRNFYFENNKTMCSEKVNAMPIDHPARTIFNEIKLENEEFNKMKTIAFLKMAIWQIQNRKQDVSYIDSNKEVEELANEIEGIDISNIEQFIKHNEQIIEEIPNKYEFCFIILYKYVVLEKDN